MVRLAISVEGQTEERFVKTVMAPHLERMNIYAIPFILCQGGGDVSLKRIRTDLNHYAKSFDKVTTLYDFYGFNAKDKIQYETKHSLEEKIVDCVAEPLQHKIIPYVQMYEFEGILFSDPQAMENNIGQEGIADWATDILRQFNDDPETINDSRETAPSKRLLAKATYLKTTHGPNIAKEIGLIALKQKCTGFRQWLTTLEAL